MHLARTLCFWFALSLAVVVAGWRPASAESIYGIAHQGATTFLVNFDSGSPSNLQSASVVTGLGVNETILGIDFRPATGQLYGLGSSSRLYAINPGTGAATPVGPQFATLLNGVSFGFDFNPQIDRIRVVSEVNQNLVLNPITGAVQLVATNLNYNAGDPNFGVDPNVVHSAYDRNVAGTLATQLYGIDTGLDILVKQGNNTGVLDTVGPLNIPGGIAAAGGFDVSGDTGIAYAALLPSGQSQSSLYTINLGTGNATPVGVIDGGLFITALTVRPIPEPSSAVALLTGLAAAIGFRRRS